MKRQKAFVAIALLSLLLTVTFPVGALPGAQCADGRHHHARLGCLRWHPGK